MGLLTGLAAVLVVGAAFWRLRRSWPDAVVAGALVLPVVVIVAATLGPPPRPVVARVRSLVALRAEPHPLPDPGQPESLFHLLAWPAALVLGEEDAVRLVAGASAGLALLFVHALARSAGQEPLGALTTQAALPLVPLLALGAGAALVGQALGQALQLLLLTHLVRRLGHLEGARDSAAAFTYLLLAQLAGPAWTVEAAGLATVLCLGEALRGAWRRALRLGVSCALATAVVLLLRYAPALIDWPTRAPGGAAADWPSAPSRAVAGCAAAVGGALGLWRLRSGSLTRRVMASALLAGLGLFTAGPYLGAPPAAGLGLLAPVAALGLGACLGQRRRTRS